MAKLDAQQRASLPDNAFSYVDSQGKRRLPIHDEAHVRNALARFNQVRFESDEARERAFRKVLTVAIEYGIAPVGFVASQMRDARAESKIRLPKGQVTFLMSDIEGSTSLISRLGDDYPPMLDAVRHLIRQAVEERGGFEVDARADEFFAVFPGAIESVKTAIAVQREMAGRSWPARVKVRIGLHSGKPARTETGYVGLAVNTASRISSAGHGGQILVSPIVKDEIDDSIPDGVSLRSLGRHSLHGLPEEVELYEVAAPGLEQGFPPLRTAPPGR